MGEEKGYAQYSSWEWVWVGKSKSVVGFGGCSSQKGTAAVSGKEKKLLGFAALCPAQARPSSGCEAGRPLELSLENFDTPTPWG